MMDLLLETSPLFDLVLLIVLLIRTICYFGTNHFIRNSLD